MSHLNHQWTVNFKHNAQSLYITTCIYILNKNINAPGHLLNIIYMGQFIFWFSLHIVTCVVYSFVFSLFPLFISLIVCLPEVCYLAPGHSFCLLVGIPISLDQVILVCAIRLFICFVFSNFQCNMTRMSTSSNV